MDISGDGVCGSAGCDSFICESMVSGVSTDIPLNFGDSQSQSSSSAITATMMQRVPKYDILFASPALYSILLMLSLSLVLLCIFSFFRCRMLFRCHMFPRVLFVFFCYFLVVELFCCIIVIFIGVLVVVVRTASLSWWEGIAISLNCAETLAYSPQHPGHSSEQGSIVPPGSGVAAPSFLDGDSQSGGPVNYHHSVRRRWV